MRIPPGLQRYPVRKKDPLQAWDSADELILDHLAQGDLAGSLIGKRVLIINDSFGALGCALAGLDVTSYTDSYLSYKGAQLNSGGQLSPLNELKQLSGTYDYILIRIPKNQSFFEDILWNLSRHLHSGSKVICGYRIKHQADASFALLEKYVGKTTTSLARKKARLVFASRDASCEAGFERYPAPPYPVRISIGSFEAPFIHHSNLFSREKLDVGTRFFLEHIPQGNFAIILDLGCANGVIGIAAKKRNPSAQVIFSDESKMAILSAQTNYQTHCLSAGPAEYYWTNCYENQRPASVDLVLCNPPFHQGTTVGDFIARQMFIDAHRALVPGGLLRVIGNTHLGYPEMLDRLFGNSKIVARNSKFTIVDARK